MRLKVLAVKPMRKGGVVVTVDAHGVVGEVPCRVGEGRVLGVGSVVDVTPLLYSQQGRLLCRVQCREVQDGK